MGRRGRFGQGQRKGKTMGMEGHAAMEWGGAAMVTIGGELR